MYQNNSGWHNLPFMRAMHSGIDMDVTKESQSFWRKLETDLNTAVPDHIKNAFQ